MVNTSNALPFISAPIKLKSEGRSVKIFPPEEKGGKKNLKFELDGKEGAASYVTGMTSINKSLENIKAITEYNSLRNKFLEYSSKKHSDLINDKNAREILFHSVINEDKNAVGLIYMDKKGSPEKVFLSTSCEDYEFIKEG